MYHKTTEELLEVLNARIDEHQAEIAALDQVGVNIKHKTLTNRAVTGEGVRIGDYIGINKALYVSYAIKYADGHTKYERETINAYSYEDENGKEIGSERGLRISRTLTPTELAGEVLRVKQLRVGELALLEAEAGNAAKLVREYNALADKVTAFQDKLTWASRSVLKVN